MTIKWTLNGDKDCTYNNWLGETPFGRILITWKGWKESHDATVDEFPGGFSAYGSPEDVKSACEAEFRSRAALAQPTAEPASRQALSNLVSTLSVVDLGIFTPAAMALYRAKIALASPAAAQLPPTARTLAAVPVAPQGEKP